MDAFLDIRLLPDPEFPATTLMNALFSKLHRGLVSFGAGSIGVSFPEVRDGRRTLGSHMRMHGPQDVLQRFMATDWLVGMRDHVQVGHPAAIPSGVRFQLVKRVQAKSSPERERRRLIARKGVSESEATLVIPDSRAELLDLPFVVLRSQSTGQSFRLFVEHLPAQDFPQPGTFSAYGLSAEATVPFF